jgi:hypothetical protein
VHYLVKLVHCRADGPYKLFLHASGLEHAIQNLPVVYLDRVRVPVERVKNVGCDLEDFGIGDHGVVGACDVEIALVELSHAAFGHSRLVTAVDLGDLVALEALHTRVHGKPPCKRDGEIVTQRAELSALVLQVVDQLRVLPIFAAENLLELKDGRVERRGPVALEDVRHRLEEAVAEGSVFAGPWKCQQGPWNSYRVGEGIQSRVPFGTLRLKLLLLSSLPMSSSWSQRGSCVQSRRRGVDTRTRRGVGRILRQAKVRRRASCRSAGQTKWGEMRCMGWK